MVDQTITGLAQGRKIQGKILFLGGPLHFFKGLQERFVETLKLGEDMAVFPDYALYAVSLGASIYAEEERTSFDYHTLVEKLENAADEAVTTLRLNPLVRKPGRIRRFCKTRMNRQRSRKRILQDIPATLT